MRLFRRPIIADGVLRSLLLPFHGLFSVTGLFSESSLYPALMGKGGEEVTSAMFVSAVTWCWAGDFWVGLQLAAG